MDTYITEIWVGGVNGDTAWGKWSPIDGMDYTTRDAAVDVAAEWEAEGYIVRIKRKAA